MGRVCHASGPKGPSWRERTEGSEWGNAEKPELGTKVNDGMESGCIRTHTRGWGEKRWWTMGDGANTEQKSRAQDAIPTHFLPPCFSTETNTRRIRGHTTTGKGFNSGLVPTLVQWDMIQLIRCL